MQIKIKLLLVSIIPILIIIFCIIGFNHFYNGIEINIHNDYYLISIDSKSQLSFAKKETNSLFEIIIKPNITHYAVQGNYILLKKDDDSNYIINKNKIISQDLHLLTNDEFISKMKNLSISPKILKRIQ